MCFDSLCAASKLLFWQVCLTLTLAFRARGQGDTVHNPTTHAPRLAPQMEQYPLVLFGRDNFTTALGTASGCSRPARA